MRRARLAGAAFLFIAVLPGCGIFTGGRGICDRWRDCGNGNGYDAIPVSYPMMAPGCAMPVANGHPYGGAPIYMNGAPAGAPFGGPIGGPFGAETLPQPAPGTIRPIPKIGIDEGKGKQYELEGASRAGPVGPALPVNGTR
jgi:hypothetical protein